jgi:hypothetical protein
MLQIALALYAASGLSDTNNPPAQLFSVQWVRTNDAPVTQIWTAQNGNAEDLYIREGYKTLKRIDAAGKTLWEKSFQQDIVFVTQDPSSVLVQIQGQARQLRIAPDGTVLSDGPTPSRNGYGLYLYAVNGDYCLNSYWTGDTHVVRLTLEGEVQWDKIFGKYGETSFRNALALPNNEYMILALTGVNFPNIWLVHINSDGEILSEKTIDPAGAEQVVFTRLPNGDLLLAASYHDIPGPPRPPPYLLRLNPDGDLVWRRELSQRPEGYIMGLDVTRDESVLAHGYAILNHHGYNWAFRLGLDGTITSDFLYPTSGDAIGPAVSPSGAVYLAGVRTQKPPLPNFWTIENLLTKLVPAEPFTNDGTVELRQPPTQLHYYPVDVIHMELHGKKGKSYVIEGSSDLKTWREITRSEPGIVPLTGATENSAQFFRAHE